MTRGRKILIIVGVLAVVLASVIVFIATNLDRIVLSAIEHYGSQATKTRVRVAKVSIKLSHGSGSIEGLTVASPPGFPSPHMLSLGSISVRIDPETVITNPVIIDDVRIISPQVVYETNDDRVSNMEVLKKNLQSQGAAAQKRPPAGRKKSGEEKRIRIKKLVIEDARVNVRVAGPGRQPPTLTLKKVEISNIGGEAGATPEEAAKQIANALASEILKEVVQDSAKGLLQKAEQKLERVRNK
ncbi:MAG TPA: hypothetical protein VF905_11835 [Nitrospirota bacterium]